MKKINLYQSKLSITFAMIILICLISCTACQNQSNNADTTKAVEKKAEKPVAKAKKTSKIDMKNPPSDGKDYIEYSGKKFEKKAFERGDNYRLHRSLDDPNLAYKLFFYPEYGNRKLGHGMNLNDKPHGTWEWWHPDTGSPKRQEESYKNGKKEGMMTKWFYNGNLQSEEPYVNDVKQGKATMWKENGEIDGYVWWKNGERDRFEKVQY